MLMPPIIGVVANWGLINNGKKITTMREFIEADNGVDLRRGIRLSFQRRGADFTIEWRE